MSTHILTNSHDNVKLPEVSYVMNYLDDCTDVPAEDVARETFDVKMKNENSAMSVAGILLRISRECAKRFFRRGFTFFAFYCFNIF